MPTAYKPKDKVKEFTLVDKFPYGYRNREDKTNLPPGILITGSKNVVTNVNGRVAPRKGYTLYGAADTSLSSILSSYDWQMHIDRTHHLRAGFLTSAGNDGKLQFVYNDTWIDLVSSLTSTAFNFADYWHATDFQAHLLWVNHSSVITEWSGGITTFASATTNTITKQGATTWAEEGFYPTGTHKVVINGIDYTATGGWGTTALTGVTPDPTAAAHTIVAGDLVHQKPEDWSNTGSIPTTFVNDLIAILRNQVYVGSLTSNEVYVSVVNDYQDYAVSAIRKVGEGALVTLDGPSRAFIPQEDSMFISAGKNQWYRTKFTLSTDMALEDFEIAPFKTSSNQATISQALTAKIKNDVVYVSQEPVVSTIGWVVNIHAEEVISDISSSIVNDINSYDFTDGSAIFHRNFLYIAVPKESIVLIYNMSNVGVDASGNHPYYWEAPQIMPISRFSIIDGELYGHSYLTSETYKLFDGRRDNGNFIEAKAVFSYNNYGVRCASKGFNKFYYEGYISSNTELDTDLNFDLDGKERTVNLKLLGTDSVVARLKSGASLGKAGLGKTPLGGDINETKQTTYAPDALPPKFRKIATFNKVPFYEYSPVFYSSGIDQDWELLAFGNNQSLTAEMSNDITI